MSDNNEEGFMLPPELTAIIEQSIDAIREAGTDVEAVKVLSRGLVELIDGSPVKDSSVAIGALLTALWATLKSCESPHPGQMEELPS